MFFDDCTVVIKTFLRPECLRKCVKSIREYYPTIQIIVADDSFNKDDKIKIDDKGINEYIILPFDSGLSVGRNELLKRVKTPFFVLVDDDTIFTEETKLEWALYVLKNTRFDIVAGLYKPDKFYGGLRKTSDEKHLIRDFGHYDEILDGFPVYDFVPNFFVAKTDKVRNFGWCDKLKVQEHTEFFWRAKGILKSTLLPYFTSINSQERALPLYSKYRFRKSIYYPMAYQIMNVSCFKDYRDKLSVNSIDENISGKLNKYANKSFDYDVLFIEYNIKNKGYPIIIVSCQKNKQKIDLIKRTWLKNARLYEYYFIIGVPNLEDEYKIEGDILYIRCSDDYLGLPEKMMKTYRYFSLHRPDVKGVLKIDDDNYINIKHFPVFMKQCIDANINYMGNSLCCISKKEYDANEKKRMIAYNTLTSYMSNKVEDFSEQYVPEISGRWYNGGHGYYLSKKAMDIITEHFSQTILTEIYEDKMVADTLRLYGIIDWDIHLLMNRMNIYNFRKQNKSDDEFNKINMNKFFIFCDVPEDKMLNIYRRKNVLINENENLNLHKNDINENVFYFRTNILFNDGIITRLSIPKTNIIIKRNVKFRLVNNEESVFKIAVIENPLGRIYRLWHYIVKTDGHKYNKFKNTMSELSFEEFVINLLPEYKTKYSVFDSQSTYLPKKESDGSIDLDYIIRLEEMDFIPTFIKRIIDKNNEIIPNQIYGINMDYNKEYSVKSQAIVENLYADDFTVYYNTKMS